MARQEQGQNLPDRLTQHTEQTHSPGHGRAGFCAQHALAVIVHVQPSSPAARAEGGPIAVWIANEPFVAGVVGNRFGDEGAAFLSGRTQPNKAKFILRGRIHETRSSVLSRDAESVSPPPMISSTPHTSRNLPLFTFAASCLVACPVPR